MKSKYYLLIDIACISIPLLASFYTKHAFYKKWGSFFKANLIVAFFYIAWDYWFTEIGIWGFNSDYITGVHIGNLPIEEVLFFICIPYACVFTYFALKKLLLNNPLEKFEKYLSIILLIGSLLLAVFNYDRLYTFSATLMTILFFSFALTKKVNLSYHYLTYFIIFPFFIISNGMLTGSLLESPIVWYNNAENLNIRFGTIPIEDSLYGLILIFLNIELFRFFVKRKLNRS